MRRLLRILASPVTCWWHVGAAGRLALICFGLVLDLVSLPPGPLPFLVLFADVPFLVLLLRDDGRRWKRWAWAYGMLHFGFALRWLAHIHPVQVLGAALILGPIYVLLGAAIRWFARRPVPLPLAVGVCVVAEEWVRTWWMGGMPWPARSLAFANDAALDPGMGSLLPATAFLGAYGLSCLCGMVAGAGVAIVRRQRAGTAAPAAWGPALWPVLYLLLLGGLVALQLGTRGLWFEKGINASSREMVVVQANIPQDLKHGEPLETKRMFDDHLSLSATAVRSLGPDHVLAILWPETMVPWPQLDADLAERFPELWDNQVGVARRLRDDVPEARGIPWLVGAIYHFRRGAERHTDVWAYGDHDSLFWVDPSQAPDMDAALPPPPPLGSQPPWVVARHDKTRLVPGGEYTPGGEIFPPLRLFRNFVSVIPELDPGAEDQVPFEFEFWPDSEPGASTAGVGTVICFELAFPERCRAWRKAGAQVLLNPGNYGWFGETGFRSQVAALARLRAAELSVTVVMAGNTGPSAFYDPLGRPYGRFRGVGAVADEPAGGIATTYRQGYAHAPVYADTTGATAYARFGDLPWALTALFLLAWALLGVRSVVPSQADLG